MSAWLRRVAGPCRDRASAEAGDLRQLHYIIAGRFAAVTGSTRYARRMLDELPALGWTVEAVEFDLPGARPDAAASAGAAGLLRGTPDGALVCLDGETLPAFVPTLGPEGRRLRLVALLHHGLALETGLAAADAALLDTAERTALRLVRGVISPSRVTARTVAAQGVAADRIAVVEPGLDRPAPGQALPCAGPVRLLAIGSVVPRKGHVALVQALAGLTDLSWRLTIVGATDRDAAETAALHAAIRRAGLAARVTLVGACPPEQIGNHYAAADLFVLASEYEGYGMVFAEAMAHGLPIVGCAGGAVGALVPDSAGLLVPPGASGALAAALRAMIADPVLRARAAAAARDCAEGLPDWRAAAARFGTALETLGALDPPGTAPPGTVAPLDRSAYPRERRGRVS